MEKKKINIGLIGFGAIGQVHTFSINSLPFFYPDADFSAKLKALAVTDIDRCRNICGQYGIPTPTDIDGIINDPDINVVDICTPNKLHYEIAEKAIKAGKNVLCEKPLCSPGQDAETLARLADGSGLVCGTVFNNRFLSPIMRAKQLITDGRLGRILSFRFDYLHDSCLDPNRTVGWKQTGQAGGGTLEDLGPHVIDLCRYLAGEPEWVSCQRQIAFDTHKTQDNGIWHTDADEADYLTLGLDNGAVGTVTVSKICTGSNDGLEFEIHGTRGALKFTLMEPNWLYFYDAELNQYPLGGFAGYTRIECVGRYDAPGGKFPSPKAPQGWLRGHIGSMYAYLAKVAGNDSILFPDFHDGARIRAITDAAIKSSLEENKKIYITKG